MFPFHLVSEVRLVLWNHLFNIGHLNYKLIYSNHDDSHDDTFSGLLSCLKDNQKMMVADRLDFCSEQHLTESILIVPMLQFGPA